MTVKDKVDLNEKVFSRTGDPLGIEALKEIEKFIDKRERDIQKDFWLTKIGIRGIYVVIFGVIGTYSLFFIDWVFTVLMTVIAIYNLIHTLSHWVFYKNNFTVKNVEKKN